MKDKEIIETIINLVNNYLDGKIDADLMINAYDDIICDNFPWGTDSEKLKTVEIFQEELAFYVKDSEKRKADENYYGPEELYKKVKQFLNTLEN